MFKSRYLSTASWTTILSAMGAVNAADAAPIVVTQALTPGASVSASGPAYNGQFDLNAFLPPGTAIANVSATGAFVTAYGYSAAAAQTTDTYTGYSY